MHLSFCPTIPVLELCFSMSFLRCNSCIPHHHLTCKIQWLSLFTELCNHYHNLFWKISTSPQRNSMLIRVFSAQLGPSLCDSMDYGLPGSSVCGISQARVLDWVPCPPPGDPSEPGIEPASLGSPALADRFLPLAPPGKPMPISRHSHFLPIPLALDNH